ncbi:MAG: class I SAM-dependent methyltransferase [Clostridia bacterium]|nr:class I SAM-dependent methyltransferase [Clostridia bacterium]
MNDFSALGVIYDSFNENACYDDYCRFILERFFSLSTHPGDYQPRAVDLCCGTGEMSLRLAKKGLDVVGVDRSEEMLQSAFQKAFSNPLLALFFVKQDMRKLKMDAKANLFVCCYDSLNYLSSTDELERVFYGVAEHLADGGVFIFDLNTLTRFTDYYDGRQFVFRKENGVLIWECRFDKEKLTCDFDVEVFSKCGELYKRSGERLRQRFFSDEDVKNALEKSSLKPVSRHAENEVFPGKEGCMRSVWVAVK